MKRTPNFKNFAHLVYYEYLSMFPISPQTPLLNSDAMDESAILPEA